jgi:hypothetical protein
MTKVPRKAAKLSRSKWLSQDISSGSRIPIIFTTVEDYPEGYPQYSALIAAHPAFQAWRRFTRIRTRLLLTKQDRLAKLEKCLDDIDRNEISPLFLRCMRIDGNEERQKVLADIDEALNDYGGQNLQTK